MVLCASWIALAQSQIGRVCFSWIGRVSRGVPKGWSKGHRCYLGEILLLRIIANLWIPIYGLLNNDFLIIKKLPSVSLLFVRELWLPCIADPDDRHYWISQKCSKMLSVGIPSKNILRCKTKRATRVDWTSGHVDVDMKILDIQPPLSLRWVSPVRPRALSDGSRRMLGMLPALPRMPRILR